MLIPLDSTSVSLRPAKRIRGEISAAIAFVIVFPVYIGYQQLVFFGVIPPALGGYFTWGTVMATPFVLISLLRSERPKFGLVDILFALLCLQLIGATVAGYVYQVDMEITLNYVAFSIKFIVLAALAYVLPWGSKFYTGIFRGIFVSLSWFAIYSYIESGGVLTPATAKILELDYQGIAYAYLVMHLISLGKSGFYPRMFLHSTLVAVLFTIGARSEFVAAVLVIVAYELLKARSLRVAAATAGGLALAAGAAFVVFSTNIEESRISGLFDIAYDESAIQRQRALSNALDTIANNPFSGDYGSYVAGEYAHNILSAWVDLGLFGFLVVVAICVIPLLVLVRDYILLGDRDIHSQCTVATIVLCFLLIFAKSFTYPLLPIVVGLFQRYGRTGRSRRSGG